jgi:hypothetical protein
MAHPAPERTPEQLHAALQRWFRQPELGQLELLSTEPFVQLHNQPWPAYEAPQRVTLLRCTVRESTSAEVFTCVAIAEPDILCLLTVNYTAVDTEDVLVLYCGWRLAFSLVSNSGYPVRQVGKDKPQFLRQLAEESLTEVAVTEELFISPHTYYAVTALQHGLPVVVLGSVLGHEVRSAGEPRLQLPLYAWLGERFLASTV